MKTSLATWLSVKPELVLALLEFCDGWAVLDSELLKQEGFPAALVDRVTDTHRGKRKGKAAVLDKNHEKVDSVRGVFCLELLYDIAKDLELLKTITRARNKLSQEDQAQILVGSITKYYSSGVIQSRAAM